MKAIAINGSPRKNWSTAQLLSSALEGAKAQGAQTELIHLYDLNFKGCISCFNCMKADGSGMWHCALKDDLQPVLDRIMQADALFVGSPVYCGNVTGETRCFLERLAFMNGSYDGPLGPKSGNQIAAAFFFTMNVRAEQAQSAGYPAMFQQNFGLLSSLNGPKEYYLCTNTWQFDDYSKYMNKIFNIDDKRAWRQEQFPKDLQSAYEIGLNLLKR
ncbi:MAG: flavodoxin family protein [Christensenellaceae bacterium]|jgi:multimeric flavodoxin WrbA|nr:flavodoxin family protein [Christensenellaceae bacterium]